LTATKTNGRSDVEEELLGGDLLYRVEDGVAWLRLNRPDMANALTPDQRNTMIDLFRDVDQDRDVRVVVLGATGGRHFCGGADLRANRSAEEPVTGTVMKMIGYGVQRLVAAILDCQKPVIASVPGTAAGIGVQLAIASDLVVMAAEASFVEVFVQRGIVPDGGAAYLLTRLCGVQRAKELMLLGEKVGAAKAKEYGLVTEVVPRAELDARTAAMAATLAAGPTVAIGLMKRLANRALDSDRAGALFDEAMAQEVVMTTTDAQEGVAAFVERRSTAFRGR
jgi:2-(1,2-epoxy-1,2-dihydrophenyl)acetyl-CoA isomerase